MPLTIDLRSTSVSHPPDEAGAQRKLPEAMRAILSDDHNYERGLAALRAMVDRIARDDEDELCDFTVALSLALAEALDRIARHQELDTADLAEVWFAD
jgi:hypothetical protein